jgi:hypothetical protein
VGALIKLAIGDIVYDTQLSDVGVLLRRKNGSTTISYESLFELWVWDIFWISEGYSLYTESGLLNMIEEGRLILFRNT